MKAFSLIEALVVSTILFLFAVLGYSVYYKNTVQMPESYRAWIKQTGNTQHLTYEEWRALIRPTEPKAPVYIYNYR